jgi:hypothetical protein
MLLGRTAVPRPKIEDLPARAQWAEDPTHIHRLLLVVMICVII